MYDAEFEFYKVRNMLSKSPRLLREDPILSSEYLKIIGLIKQKKILERSSDKFDPVISPDLHYYDLEKEEARRQELIKKQMDEKLKNMQQEEIGGEESKLLEKDRNMETQIKNEKKAKAREQLKIMKQFESMADSFAN